MSTVRALVSAAVGSAAMATWLIFQGPFCAVLSAQEPPPAVENFFQAVVDNNTNAVASRLAADTNLVRALYYGRLPLHVAASKGHSATVGLLLKHGADINAPGDTLDTVNSQITALHAAISHNQPAVCRQLLAAGANPNVLSPWEGSALHMAVGYHRDEMVVWLLDYGADPFLLGGTHYPQPTAFALAVTARDGKLIPPMLRASRVKAAGSPGRTPSPSADPAPPLKKAAVEFLAAHGRALLATAASQGQLEAVEALLNAGVPPDGTTLEGVPLLHAFARAFAEAAMEKGFPAGRWARLRELLERHGAVCDVFAATGLGDLESTRRLVRAEPRVRFLRDREGQTPLHWAVLTDRLPFTAFWLEAGVPVAATNLAGQTALHLAASQGRTGQVARLLAERAPTTLRDTNGWTPLEAAIHARQPETIRLLLGETSGAARPERGFTTPLHQAAADGNVVALAALATVAELEARNELGLTSFQVAVQQGQLGAAALLADRGADVNVRDPDGNSALHLALLQPLMELRGRPSAGWVERKKQEQPNARVLRYLSSEASKQAGSAWLQAVSLLLACGADAAVTNRAGQTVLQIALENPALAFDEDRKTLLQLFSAQGSVLNATDVHGDTALHRAARSFDRDPVAALVAAGAGVNATNHQGRTPVHAAVERLGSWPSPLVDLIEARANLNIQDAEGFTALHLLALSKSMFKAEATRALLQAGAKPNVQDKRRRTPAHLLLAGQWPWHGAAKCLPLLVNAGADLGLTDDRGQTPLHYLAACGSSRPLFFIGGIEEQFRSAKADLAARDLQGDTPLHVAARAGTQDVLDWLVERGADLEATNHASETPRMLAGRASGMRTPFASNPETDVFQATREGRLDALAALLRADPAWVNMTNSWGQTPLRVAVLARQTNALAFLERQGAAWDAISAVRAGRVEVLRELLAREPALVKTAEDGNPLLHLAAAAGNCDLVGALLEVGADLRAISPHGFSPLGAALLRRQMEAAELLRHHGATENAFDAACAGLTSRLATWLSRDASLVHATNGHGHTLLHLAAVGDHVGAAELLLRQGADMEAVDRYGLAPLHLAAAQGATEVAALLLKHEAKPDVRTKPAVELLMDSSRLEGGVEGNTPLHWAALADQTNVLRLLLQAGVAVNATNAAGITALDLTANPRAAFSLVWMRRATAFLPGWSGALDAWQAVPLASRKAREQETTRLLQQAGGSRSPAARRIFGRR